MTGAGWPRKGHYRDWLPGRLRPRSTHTTRKNPSNSVPVGLSSGSVLDNILTTVFFPRHQFAPISLPPSLQCRPPPSSASRRDPSAPRACSELPTPPARGCRLLHQPRPSLVSADTAATSARPPSAPAVTRRRRTKSSLPGTPYRQLSPREAVWDAGKKRSKELELGLRSHPDDRFRPTRQASRLYLGNSRITDASMIDTRRNSTQCRMSSSSRYASCATRWKRKAASHLLDYLLCHWQRATPNIPSGLTTLALCHHSETSTTPSPTISFPPLRSLLLP